MITLSKAAAQRAIGHPATANRRLEQRVLIRDQKRGAGPYTLEIYGRHLDTAVTGSQDTIRDAELEVLNI